MSISRLRFVKKITSQPVEDDDLSAAIKSLPDFNVVDVYGPHMLCRVSEDYYVLIGPDEDSAASGKWACANLPSAPEGQAWVVPAFESYGETLLTHFELTSDERR